jgi:hypothetical protein
MPPHDQPDFDDQFGEAIAEWRHRHQLREDDAVVLLLELFRIHQQHWDELRRREMPSFDELRDDIAHLSEAAQTFQQESRKLLEKLPRAIPRHRPLTVTWVAALFAAIATGLGGSLLGKGFI